MGRVKWKLGRPKMQGARRVLRFLDVAADFARGNFQSSFYPNTLSVRWVLSVVFYAAVLDTGGVETEVKPMPPPPSQGKPGWTVLREGAVPSEAEHWPSTEHGRCHRASASQTQPLLL